MEEVGGGSDLRKLSSELGTMNEFVKSFFGLDQFEVGLVEEGFGSGFFGWFFGLRVLVDVGLNVSGKDLVVSSGSGSEEGDSVSDVIDFSGASISDH